ncbi:kelch repeat and BTB domain-containing protein 2-like [Branchiostoma floridae x Branchiostoma japonicum]
MFGEILSYIYSGTLHVSLDKVQPLYQAADLLQLDYVRDTCSSYMAMNVEHSTFVDLYKFSDVFSLDNVRNRCLQLIHRNFVELASSEEFCSLSVNQLTEIISHDELGVKEETAVWEAVVRWVQHSREDRLGHLPSILPHIRFNLLTTDDTAAILDHPLVRENHGSSEVIRNVVQKGNPDLKPRHGMFTEMMLLFRVEIDEILFMNPQEGKYISCSYDDTNFAEAWAMTVTSDNDIYLLSSQFDEDSYSNLSMLKYNHAENVWKHAGMSSVSNSLQPEATRYEKLLVEVDHLFYNLGVKTRRILGATGSVHMRKYNRLTDQWQDCSQLQIHADWNFSVPLLCGPHIYFIMKSEMHRYDLSQDSWCERTPPKVLPEVRTAVAIGTEIFCTDHHFTQTMVYDTESDCWQKLQGWSNPGNLDVKVKFPYFFLYWRTSCMHG